MPVDLAQDTIPASLVERPAISTVEGVTMYLAEDEVMRVLESIAHPDSRLVINFGIGGGRGQRSRRATRTGAAAGGETFQYEPTQSEAVTLLRRAGWEPEEIVTGREMGARYLSGTSLPTDLTEDAFVVTAAATTSPGTA